MRKQKSVLPTTVVDQIRLWEQEGQRVTHESGGSSLSVPPLVLTTACAGYLYDDFSSAADYELVRNYAKQLDVLLWELERNRKMFVTAEGHTQVRYVPPLRLLVLH
jgi:transcription initiation factor TFIIH subunit 4